MGCCKLEQQNDTSPFLLQAGPAARGKLKAQGWGTSRDQGRRKTQTLAEPVPREALVKPSRMTQMTKKQMVNTMHDHVAHITPKGKQIVTSQGYPV